MVESVPREESKVIQSSTANTSKPRKRAMPGGLIFMVLAGVEIQRKGFVSEPANAHARRDLRGGLDYLSLISGFKK
jgi:hypothetical protein